VAVTAKNLIFKVFFKAFHMKDTRNPIVLNTLQFIISFVSLSSISLKKARFSEQISYYLQDLFCQQLNAIIRFMLSENVLCEGKFCNFPPLHGSISSIDIK